MPLLEAYLKRYPKADDARTLGKRAVCLAWALADEGRVDELLGQLDRFYRRRGFVRPSTRAF